MRLIEIDRTPMMGKEGRVYQVIGEDEVCRAKAWDLCETLVVSVTSPSCYLPDWSHEGNVAAFVGLLFWDVSPDSESAFMPCISGEQCAKVADAVRNHPWHEFLFQCEAGVSRSAGLCVAVARFFGDDEVAAECYERYAPNPLVVERLSKALSEESR